MIHLKKNINYVPRLPHWISNREKFYTMERNERVEEFQSKHLKSLFSSISSFDLRTYPDPKNIYLKLSTWLKVKPENIFISDGADGGLLRIFNVFADKGDKVLALEPSFAMYPVYCQMFKAKYLPFKLKISKDFNYFTELKKKITKDRPKIIALANPNQPLEAMLKISEVKMILKLAKKIKSIVVIDEAYAHFNRVNTVPLIKDYNNLIVVRTFSKAFGLAGARIGYTVANKNLISLLQSIKPIYEVNGVNTRIIEFFLKNINIMRHHVDQISKSRLYFEKFLRQISVKMIGKFSNTVLFKLDTKKQVDIMIKKLYEKKYIIRPMTIDGDDRYIRCTLGHVKTMKHFVKNMKKIMNTKQFIENR